MNQFYYQADGEWTNGRPFEADFLECETVEEAAADARNEYARLTVNEKSKVTMWIRKYERDGEGSAHSVGGSIPVDL